MNSHEAYKKFFNIISHQENENYREDENLLD